MSLPDSDDQKNWFNKLKSKFTTADAFYLAGTAAIALANPKGVSAQAKIIEDDINLSKSMGANLVQNSAKVINGEVIPSMELVEAEKAEALEFINARLQGVGEGDQPVKNPFIRALINAGPAYWRAFKSSLEKEDKRRLDNGMSPLRSSEIENLFSDAETILSDYGEGTEVNGIPYQSDPRDWENYLDQRYGSWNDLIDRTGAMDERQEGLLTAMYNPAAGAIGERDTLLSMMPGRNVGGEYFSMDDLFAISQATQHYGIDPNTYVQVPGGYDMTRARGDNFQMRLLETENWGSKLSKAIESMDNPETVWGKAASATTSGNALVNQHHLDRNGDLIVNSNGDPIVTPFDGSMDNLRNLIRVLSEKSNRTEDEDTALQYATEMQQLASSDPQYILAMSQFWANEIIQRNDTARTSLEQLTPIETGLQLRGLSNTEMNELYSTNWTRNLMRINSAYLSGVGTASSSKENINVAKSSFAEYYAPHKAGNSVFLSEEHFKLFLAQVGARGMGSYGNIVQAGDVFQWMIPQPDGSFVMSAATPLYEYYASNR